MTRRQASEAVLVMALAGSLWGSSFALVELVDGTSPLLVTGLRFTLYGLVSAVGLTVARAWRGIPWRVAFLHAATGYVGMYLAEVVAIHLAGPGPAIAVIGTVPVVYALVGARRDRIPVRHLLPSVTVLAVGVAAINAEAFAGGEESVLGIVVGMGVAMLGVGSWCVYALHNTDHLVRNPEVGPATWSSAVGVAAGALSVPLVILGMLGGADPVMRLGPVVLFLALGPSWLATVLWNRASVRVPRAVAGQLIVFEPLSAFVLVHLLTGEAPTAVELVGEVLLVVGAVLALGRLAGMRRSPADRVSGGAVEGGDDLVGPGRHGVGEVVVG